MISKKAEDAMPPRFPGYGRGTLCRWLPTNGWQEEPRLVLLLLRTPRGIPSSTRGDGHLALPDARQATFRSPLQETVLLPRVQIRRPIRGGVAQAPGGDGARAL